MVMISLSLLCFCFLFFFFLWIFLRQTCKWEKTVISFLYSVDLRSLVQFLPLYLLLVRSAIFAFNIIAMNKTIPNVRKRKNNDITVTLFCSPKEKYEGYIERNIHCAWFQERSVVDLPITKSPALHLER